MSGAKSNGGYGSEHSLDGIVGRGVNNRGFGDGDAITGSKDWEGEIELLIRKASPSLVV